MRIIFALLKKIMASSMEAMPTNWTTSKTHTYAKVKSEHYRGSKVLSGSDTRSSGYFLIARGRWVLETPILMRNSSFLFSVFSTLVADTSGQRVIILPTLSLSNPISSKNEMTCICTHNYKLPKLPSNKKFQKIAKATTKL